MTYANLVLVAATSLAAATGALAQAPDFGARSVLHNDGGAVGGGHRMFIAGGSEMLIVDASRAGGEGEADVPGQPGRFAVMDSNHGDGPQVRYLASVPHSPGRHAQIFGGGDERVILYVEPARTQLTRR
jgi:hypothetical protein